MILMSLPEDNGGADFSLVRVGKDGKPECVTHGAMNKLSRDGIWRCITTTGTNGRRCDAGALELTGALGGGWDMSAVNGWPVCVCNGPGVQTCGLHPEHRVRTKEESIAFRKAWDARVEESRA